LSGARSSTPSVKSVFGEDKMVTKGLSKFLMKLIHVKVKDLGWEPIGSEDCLVVKLRPSMTEGSRCQW
jgi:hypothetical protein